MKSNLKKRLLAMVLCVVMVLGLSISVMAEAEPAPEGAGTEALMLSEGETSQTEGAADNSSETPVTTAAEPAPEAAPEPTPEATPAPEATPEPTPEATPAPEVSPEPTPETTPAPTVTGEPAPETESAGTENVTESTEPVQETEESQKEPALTEESGTEKNQDTEEAEKIITLESKLDDMTVVLSGPESSFPEDTELSISVSEPAKEAEELIEEAVQKQAEEQQMAVRDYTALDIRLLSDGEEIQPLGPVQVVFEKPETETAVQSEEQVETKVFHVDEQTGDAEDMKAEQAEEGQVSIETTHFSIYVVVDMDQLGGQIDLTVQHWATIEVLNGVDGKDGLVGIQGPNGTAGDNVVKLDTKEEFYQIYTDDVIKLDNKLNKNVGELSKVLLADANSTIKNYELKEIWVLKDNQTLGTNTINKTDTNAFDGEKSKWTVYTLDDKDQTVKLTKNSIIRMIYEPVKADNALIQDVTFYDYDVTDGKRYNEKGQEDSNGQWLNTTNQGINNALNYSEGNSSNRLAVGQASAFVDHSYRDARAANGEILNHGGDDSDSAKKGIVTSIGQDGPTYNGVYDAGLFNNDLKIGKTILNNYDLVFNQNGDTYTLTAVNKDGSRVLSNLEVLKDVYDGKAWPSGTKQIFSNNFWPLDTEDLTGHDPLMGAYSGQWKSLNNKLSAAPSDDNTAHNWFFGMRYSFEFTLGDYTGPLNFYFRGDDDFWLFVVCE